MKFRFRNKTYRWNYRVFKQNMIIALGTINWFIIKLVITAILMLLPLAIPQLLGAVEPIYL